MLSSYSIKDLEALSGIKAHTIRAWEKRYNIITPHRTTTNIRYYTDEALKLLLNISLLYKHGYKVSKLAELSFQDIQQQALTLINKNFQPNVQIQGLIRATIDLDKPSIDKLLSRNIIQYGLESTMMNVAFPFLHRIGILWQTGAINPAQEHLFTNIIRQKIIVAIDGLTPIKASHENTYLLFLPEWEQHELSLLFVSYLLQARGKQVIFLGSNTPIPDIELVYQTLRPGYLFTALSTGKKHDELQEYIDTLVNRFSQATLLVSGKQIVKRQHELQLPEGIQVIPSLESFITQLNAETYAS